MYWNHRWFWGITTSIIIIVILFFAIMLSDNIKAKTEYEPTSTKTKLRRVTISKELHDRTWESNEIPVWEIPTQYSDQNSDDLETQQGSTLILSKEEKTGG